MGDEIYINLNLNKDISRFKTDKKRKTAIEYEYKKYFNYITKLAIPAGYKVDYIPETVAFSNEFLTGTIQYSQTDKEIVYSQTITLNFLTLSLEEQKEVNKLIDKIEKNYKEIVVFKKL